VVNTWTTAVDAQEVTRAHAATRPDRASATIPRPRAGDKAPGTLAVREWHRFGRRRLDVTTADGSTVGSLNVHTGVVTLTDEKDRAQVQAAIAGWFAAALTGPVPVDPAENRHRAAGRASRRAPRTGAVGGRHRGAGAP
jgi:hypothetical protein